MCICYSISNQGLNVVWWLWLGKQYWLWTAWGTLTAKHLKSNMSLSFKHNAARQLKAAKAKSATQFRAKHDKKGATQFRALEGKSAGYSITTMKIPLWLDPVFRTQHQLKAHPSIQYGICDMPLISLKNLTKPVTDALPPKKIQKSQKTHNETRPHQLPCSMAAIHKLHNRNTSTIKPLSICPLQ